MGLIGWLKSKIGRKLEKPLRSFVWLLDEPRMLDSMTLQRIVEQALDVTFPSGEDATEFVVGEPPALMVKLADHMLLVNCFPVPYLKDPEREAARMTERRLQHIVRTHRAWISVDMMGDYEDGAEAEGWRKIGRIAAGLADDRCLALVVPATDQCIPYAEELLDQLRSDNPLESLSWQVAPVVNIHGDDPRMKAAVQEARNRWPEFVEAFQNPKPGHESFSVKLPVSDGRNTEFIWISVVSIDGDDILGDLANEPVDLQFMRLGSRVRGKVADLNDWAYIDNDDMVGGFTSRVLMEQA